MWEVEYTDEFEAWWESLSEGERIDVASVVGVLENYGPNLRFPYSSQIVGAKTDHLRELRIQHAGKPYRVLYAFDSRRCAILLIGGKKTQGKRWYNKYLPLADKLYSEHIAALKQEELING